MNQMTIQIIIGSATFLLTIIGALFLNQQHTNKLMESFRNEVGAKIDGLGAKMDARFDAVNVRFDAVDERFDHLEARIDRLERQFDNLYKPVR